MVMKIIKKLLSIFHNLVQYEKNAHILIAFFLYLTYKWRNSCFLGQIFEVEILMELHVLRYPESEKHIFSVWSVCVCLCVCYQHNSKTNYSRKIKFGILHLHHVQMLLETFCEYRTKTLCTGVHKRILIH